MNEAFKAEAQKDIPHQKHNTRCSTIPEEFQIKALISVSLSFVFCFYF